MNLFYEKIFAMIANLYLFTGDNLYWLDKETNRRVSNFVQKFGENSVSIFNCENWNEGEAKQSIFGGWLFSTKKLTIIKWLPIGTSINDFKISQIENFMEELMQNAENISADNLLVFANGKPDKRSRFYKFLQKNANIKVFDLPKEAELKSQIKLDLWNIQITDDALDKLIEKVGMDLYRLYSELEKLILFCSVKNIKQITKDIVEEIVFGLLETEVFEFLSLIFVNKNKATKYLQNMQDQWVNWNALSGVLYWWLKIYITIYHFAKKWIKDAKTIANQTWINVYSLFQPIKSVEFILKNWKKIENMYKKLLDIDFDIKSGKTEERFFWLEIKKHINSFKF